MPTCSSCCVLFHWKVTPTRTFNEFLYEFLRIFLIPENSLKFANFFCRGNEFSIYGDFQLQTAFSEKCHTCNVRFPMLGEAPNSTDQSARCSSVAWSHVHWGPRCFFFIPSNWLCLSPCSLRVALCATVTIVTRKLYFVIRTRLKLAAVLGRTT